MDKEKLKALIAKKTKEAESKRRKRAAIVIAAFTVVFFLIYCIFEEMPESFMDVIDLLVPSLILSGLHCGINQAVFEHLYERDESEQQELKFLKKQLSDIEKQEFDEYIENKHKKE